MATKLKKMRLTSVDLVRAGANQEADICLFKSADPPEATESPQSEEKNLFKRFLDWMRENPTEAENEPHSPIEKADDQPDLEFIYKSALAESLQSIMADDTLTEVQKKEMSEESLRQYADRIRELEREEDRLEGDHDDDDDDDEEEDIEEIVEVIGSRKSNDGFFDYIEESQIRKYNHNHGADGKFTFSSGGRGSTGTSPFDAAARRLIESSEGEVHVWDPNGKKRTVQGGGGGAVNARGTMSPKELASHEARRDALWDKQDHGKLSASEKKELKDLENRISEHYDEKKRQSGGGSKKPSEMTTSEIRDEIKRNTESMQGASKDKQKELSRRNVDLYLEGQKREKH